jgi:hypothetical protein
MFAKSSLDSLNIDGWTTPPSLNNSLLIKAANKISKAFVNGEIEIPQRSTLVQIHKRLQDAFQTKSTKGLSRYDINNSPWVIFDRFTEQKPLMEQWWFFRFYTKLIDQTDNYRLFNALYHSYLMSYPFEKKYITEVQSYLRSVISKTKDRKIQNLGAEILERKTLDKNIHKEMSAELSSASNIEYYLMKKNLLGSLSSSRLTSVVFETYLSNYLNSMRNAERSIQSQQIISLTDFTELNGKLRFPELKIQIVNVLLKATSFFPIQPLEKEPLKELVLKCFGDPRVDLAGWHGVDEEARLIFQSWLVEKTMVDFFNLLSHVAQTQSDADRHWKYRKRFWNAYLNKGYIVEAWVALGPRAMEQAPKFINGTNHYASLSGGAPTHSALLLNIGGVWITEWSHSGSYRVWDNDALAPKPYKKHYSRDDLITNNDHEGAHHGNETGGWQGRLSSLINDLTGLKVTSKDYMHD